MNTVKAYIDLQALRFNIEKIKDTLPNCKIVSVIKADAYGHGSVACAKALDDLVECFAVARIEEAIELREAGISKDIILLGGFFLETELPLVEKYDLSFAIHDVWQIEILEKYQTNQKFKGWCQVNIGMQRLGFNVDQVKDVYKRISNIECIQKPIGLIAHLSCADEESTKDFNELQLSAWNSIKDISEGPLCLLNSAAIEYYSEYSTDFIRPGIIQYGVSPSSSKIGTDLGLKPVMTLCSKVISIRDVDVGDAVGYGAYWVCDKKTRIAIVAAGYADGYPRSMPNGCPVLINGQVMHTVGHVCMDMMFVDIGLDSDVNINDEVVLWGNGLPVEHIAQMVGTIPYELLTRVTKRVKYIYNY